MFANEESSFSEIVEKAVSAILAMDGVGLKNTQAGIGAGYFRIDVAEGDTCLTVDFVNDIAFRLGSPAECRGIRIDTLSNIFTNKMSALIGRDELKDIADVREICRNCSFQWDKVLEASMEKEASVDSEYIDYKLFSLVKFLRNNAQFLDTINWIQKPDTDVFISDLEKMRQDILALSDNSLCAGRGILLEDLSL